MGEMTKRSALVAVFALMAAGAHAQTKPSMVGAEVVDAKGKAVGKIEKVISGPAGQPLQVMVRVDHVLRTLPVDALAPKGANYASVLSRAEIAALPPSE
jgi:rRNA processing protein Gar1